MAGVRPTLFVRPQYTMTRFPVWNSDTPKSHGALLSQFPRKSAINGAKFWLFEQTYAIFYCFHALSGYHCIPVTWQHGPIIFSIFTSCSSTHDSWRPWLPILPPCTYVESWLAASPFIAKQSCCTKQFLSEKDPVILPGYCHYMSIHCWSVKSLHT